MNGEFPLREVSWPELVERIQRAETDAMDELYRIVSKGARFYLLRTLGPQEAEDQLHDAFLAVVECIMKGELRDPQALMPFVAGVLRRRVARQIGKNVRRREREVGSTELLSAAGQDPDPEQAAASAERRTHAAQALESLSERDREILTRFYVREHDRAQICRDMQLTETQFRLFKSRAMARLREIWQRRLRDAGPAAAPEPASPDGAEPSSSGGPRTPAHRAD